MNRIYQGRITKVESPQFDKSGKSNVEWGEEKNGESLLWQHHELFQDATNYYLTAFLAMAKEPENPLYELKSRLISENPDHESYRIWKNFRRRGGVRKGLVESMERHLDLGKGEILPEKVFNIILQDNENSPKVIDLALRELLAECNGDGAIQQKGREMFPRFCWNKFAGSFPHERTFYARKENEFRLQTELHELKTEDEIREFAGQCSLSWVVNIDEAKPKLKGEAARVRLLKAVDHFAQVYGSSSNTKAGNRITEYLKSNEGFGSQLIEIRQSIIGAAVEKIQPISRNRKSIPDRTEALLLFMFEPCAFTCELLKVSFPLIEEKKRKAVQEKLNPSLYQKFGDDAIRLARGKRGFVFPAFTSLSTWIGGKAGETTWKEFDIAAFKEALKAVHQVESKGEERANERKDLEHFVACMEGKAKWKDSVSEEGIQPVLLIGDPRIERLLAIQNALKGEQPDEEEESNLTYGFHPRTIRGFEELAQAWGKIKRECFSNEEAYISELDRVRKEHQIKHRDDVGSGTLFKLLSEKENWIIWKEPGSEDLERWRRNLPKVADKHLDFSKNPLKTFTQWRKLLNDIKELKEPVRLTPADAQLSRRQFYFSDVANFSLRGEFRHDSKKLAVTVPVARKTATGWQKNTVRISYSAPRLKRDGMRTTEDELKVSSAVHQPLMEALGVPAGKPKDLAKLPVSLMPEGHVDEKGKRRIFLNFPVEVDTTQLVRNLYAGSLARNSNLNEKGIEKHLSQAIRMDRQFASFNNKNMYLRWPNLTDNIKEPKEGWWWDYRNSFQLLSVDLGQRFSAAVAVLDCHKEKLKDKDRFIGSDGQNSWFSSLKEMNNIRLRGEGAKVIEKRKWVCEEFGARGRFSSEAEMREAFYLCDQMGEPDYLKKRQCKQTFPEINDSLLRLFKRVIWRVRTLQRLKRELSEDPIKALGDFNLNAEQSDEQSSFSKPDDLINHVDGQLKGYYDKLPKLIICLANRVLPLRERQWEWEKIPGSNSYALTRSDRLPSRIKGIHIRGQRGLSLDRIKQLEEFRKRVQALNRVMMSFDGSNDRGKRSSLRRIELPDACPDVGDKILRLKEERVNQTAHAILARALGLRLKAHSKPIKERQARDIHGEYEVYRNPVDFVVLEDLSRYQSSQGRAPRENSALMRWTHRAVLNKLKELAEPYGLPVLETNPSYSSRFCSRTGVAGFRAVEVNLESRNEWLWQHELEQYKKLQLNELKADHARRLHLEEVKSIFDVLEKLSDKRTNVPRTLLVPQAGGTHFVPVDGPAVNADLNAAINLGLRAVANPQVLEINARIPTFIEDGTVYTKTSSKQAKARWGEPRKITLKKVSLIAELLRDTRQPNFFIDIGKTADFHQAEIEGVELPVSSGKALWTSVKIQSWQIVNRLNNERLKAWNVSPGLAPHFGQLKTISEVDEDDLNFD